MSFFFCNKICFCHFRLTGRMKLKVSQMIADWTLKLLEILMQDSWMWNMWSCWSLCRRSSSLQHYCFNLQTADSSLVVHIIFLMRSCCSLWEENIGSSSLHYIKTAFLLNFPASTCTQSPVMYEKKKTRINFSFSGQVRSVNAQVIWALFISLL